MLIRPFQSSDAGALRAVFYSSVHTLAAAFYTPEQLQAWAPAVDDPQPWLARLERNRPWVAVLEGQIAGFADLQALGFIDHFFVAAASAGRGVGTRLMAHVQQQARQQAIGVVAADVSLAAQGFFARAGFGVVARQEVCLRSQTLTNIHMQWRVDG